MSTTLLNRNAIRLAKKYECCKPTINVKPTIVYSHKDVSEFSAKDSNFDVSSWSSTEDVTKCRDSHTMSVFNWLSKYKPELVNKLKLESSDTHLFPFKIEEYLKKDTVDVPVEHTEKRQFKISGSEQVNDTYYVPKDTVVDTATKKTILDVVQEKGTLYRPGTYSNVPYTVVKDFDTGAKLFSKVTVVVCTELHGSNNLQLNVTKKLDRYETRDVVIKTFAKNPLYESFAIEWHKCHNEWKQYVNSVIRNPVKHFVSDFMDVDATVNFQGQSKSASFSYQMKFVPFEIAYSKKIRVKLEKLIMNDITDENLMKVFNFNGYYTLKANNMLPSQQSKVSS
jgi:hypothetical protein